MAKSSRYPWQYGLFLAAYYTANGIYQGYAVRYFQAAGMGTALQSVVMAAFPLVSIFTQPFWGAVSDRSQSRNRVLAGLIVAAAMLLMCYRLSGAFWALLPLCCLFSAVYTSIQPLGDSIILEALARDEAPFGPIRMMGTVTFAVTNLLWGILVNPESVNLIVYGTSAMLLVTLASTRLLPPTAGHQSNGGRKMNMTAILRLPHMAGLMALLMLLQLTMGYFYSFFTLHFMSLEGSTSALMGLCYFLSAMSEIPFLLNADRLFDRLGVGKLLSISAVALTLRWTLLATTDKWYIAMASQVLHGWGFIVMTVSMAKYMNVVIPDELKASGQMLIGVVGFGIARTFGILGGGLVAAAMGGVQKGFVLTAIVAGLTALYFVPKYLRMKPLNGKDTQ